jgi:hypothetical protein
MLSLLTLPIKGIIIALAVYIALVLKRQVTSHPTVHGILVLVGTLLLVGTLGALVAAFALNYGEATYIKLVPGILCIFVLYIVVGIRYLGFVLLDATILSVFFSVMTVSCWFFAFKGWTDSIDPIASFLSDVVLLLYILLGAVLVTVAYLVSAKAGHVVPEDGPYRPAHKHPVWLVGEVWVFAAVFSGIMILALMTV